jgi:hypothetical protein
MITPSRFASSLSRSVVVATVALAALVCRAGTDTAAAADQGPALEIGVSLRGVAGQTIEQGEPLRIAVRLEAPADVAEPIVLAPAGGNWADAIGVELVRAGGNVVVARGVVVGQPESPRAMLDRDHLAGGMWRIPAEAMAGVGPGEYVVRARLAISAGVGWTGTALSDDANLRIVASSADPERTTQHVLARAQEAWLAGKPEEAARLLDPELVKTPDNIALLTLRGAIALRTGNLAAAQACVAHATTLLPSDLEHPSLELRDLQSRIMTALLFPPPGAAPVTPPAWTWPPMSVLIPPKNPPPVPTNPLFTGSPVARQPAAAVTSPRILVASPPPVRAKEDAAIAVAGQPTKGAEARSDPGALVPPAELMDAKIIADPAGQWAATATAGTKYGKTQYSPAQATGAPNISTAGNSPDAWCPENKNVGTDWLELTFAKPVHATEVRVRQNDAVGAITKIEAIEPDGTAHVWWEGVDPYVAPAVREIAWFAVRVPRTPYLVAKVKITLNLASGPGYKEIDAVQLVGAAQ